VRPPRFIRRIPGQIVAAILALGVFFLVEWVIK
jgi:hypothetical protein